jgi:hypothetical protein
LEGSPNYELCSYGQTKKYGAIIAIDLLHEGRLVASLIKENTNLVDYSGKPIFQDIDTAIDFYLTKNRLSNGSGCLYRSSQYFVFSFTIASKIIESPGPLPLILVK